MLRKDELVESSGSSLQCDTRHLRPNTVTHICLKVMTSNTKFVLKKKHTHTADLISGSDYSSFKEFPMIK